MVVTRVAEHAKSRYQIFLDGQFAFVLYRGELRRFQIAEGKELAEENYRCIMEEILPRRAKLRCMNLLQSKDYTEKQLKDKLGQGGYPQTCIDEVISYVKAYGYVDDESYAKAYIECHIENKSKTDIEIKLLQRGIPKEVIRGAFEALRELGVEQDEAKMVSALLAKKRYRTESATPQERRKMYGYLYRRGFSPDIIMRALS